MEQKAKAIENLQNQIQANDERLVGMKRAWAAIERNIVEQNERLQLQISQMQVRIDDAGNN
jgi:hypothetical protein